MVHTNWDNLWIRWTECQRWWEVSKDCKSFVKTADEVRRRTLIRDVDKKKESSLLEEMVIAQSKAEEERRKRKKKEREKQRIWDHAWGNQKRIQILGDSNLIVNWMNGRWRINNQKFQKMVQRTHNVLDKTDLRPMADHLDMFQYVY